MKDLSPAILEQRTVKSSAEIEKLITASRHTDQILEKALGNFRVGMTENDLVAEIEYLSKKAGAKEMSFSTTVLSKDKSAMPHGNPGEQSLDKGIVLIDFGIVYDGYCSDITRTFHIGEWQGEIKKIYQTVLEAQMRAIQQAKIGMTFEELDSIARQHIEENGYGASFVHRLGHGMGIEVHEYPSVGKGNGALIREGNVFTIEPGVYVPGLGGVRIEDAVYVTADGAVPLTSFPKKLENTVLPR